MSFHLHLYNQYLAKYLILIYFQNPLKKENQNLAEKANALSELQNQLNVLTAKENLLKNELLETESRLSKKDAKLDEMRKTSFEKMQKLQKEKNEILEQLKDFETTKKYLSYLEKIAFFKNLLFAAVNKSSVSLF